MSTKETLDIYFLVGSHSRHSNHWMLWIHDKVQQHSHSWLHCYELRRLYGILLASTQLVYKCQEVPRSCERTFQHYSAGNLHPTRFHNTNGSGNVCLAGRVWWNQYTYILSSNMWQDMYLHICLTAMCTNTFCLCVCDVYLYISNHLMCNVCGNSVMCDVYR